jgi:hypothetical protein
MNVHRWKALAWLVALALGGYLGWYVTDYVTRRGELEARLTEEEQRRVLDAVEVPEPPKDDVVDLKLVNETFHRMNWTGREDPKPVETTGPTEPVKPPIKPVADLLQVLLVQVDTDDPKGSLAFVKYLDNQLIAASNDPADRTLRIDQSLPAPHGHVKVAGIAIDGVRFTFEDEERAPETVAPIPFPSGNDRIVKVGPGGAVMPQRQPGIAVAANPVVWNPTRTTQIGRNKFLLGSEDLERWNRDYAQILSQEVRYQAHRDPRTGKVDGIEIKDVRAGSLAAQHGVQGGEVVKSINGHPVTSVNDAIAFVKKEAPTTTTWVVVYELQGREYTRTYQSPN